MGRVTYPASDVVYVGHVWVPGIVVDAELEPEVRVAHVRIIASPVPVVGRDAISRRRFAVRPERIALLVVAIDVPVTVEQAERTIIQGGCVGRVPSDLYLDAIDRRSAGDVSRVKAEVSTLQPIRVLSRGHRCGRVDIVISTHVARIRPCRAPVPIHARTGTRILPISTQYRRRADAG